MKIKITTTLNVSAENIGLIPVVANSLGYENWKANKISNEFANLKKEDPEATIDDTIDEYSVNTFIKEFLAKDNSLRIIYLISPVIDTYFGLNEADKAQALKDQLANGAVLTEVIITE